LVDSIKSGDSGFVFNQIELEMTAPAPSLAVLSQSYYHLGHAFVDGKPVPLMRANLAFQAIEISAGTHHAKLVYRDPNLEIGATLSALSLIAGSLIWLRMPGLRQLT
jgi:uncharacterized membrane protein YfhO